MVIVEHPLGVTHYVIQPTVPGPGLSSLYGCINQEPYPAQQARYEKDVLRAAGSRKSKLNDDLWFGKPGVVPEGGFKRSENPGPFLQMSVLQETVYGNAVVAREQGRGYEGRVLCLKIIGKKELIEKRGEKNVFAELAAYKRMASVEKPDLSAFVMELDFAMQDQHNLYFGMPLLSHDLLEDFLRDLYERRELGKKWLAQMVMGIAFIHDAGIIHRDIKPENILIDYHMNIRITDFGCAYVHVHEERALRSWEIFSSEVIGTQEYMAPEMYINRDKRQTRTMYGIPVDYWAIGCVFFELMAAVPKILFTTYIDRLRYERWDRAAHGGKSFFSTWEFDEYTIDILEGLINFEPDERFTIKNLAGHPYFRRRDGKSTFFDSLIGDSRIAKAEFTINLSEEPLVISPLVKLPPPLQAGPFEEFGWINPNGNWADCLGREKRWP